MFDASNKMRILFFDTETNGLPLNRYAPPHMVTAWPHVLQLAWELWDIGAGVCETRGNVLITPRHDMKWSEEAAKIHGISPKMLRELGVPIDVALRWFVADMARADYAVAHNLAFDRAVIHAESHRLGIDPTAWWPTTGEWCSMLGMKDWCAIPSSRGTTNDPYKWPRLAEVWARLWPDRAAPTDLHDAAGDVRCLSACVREGLRRGIIVLRPVTPPMTYARDVFALPMSCVGGRGT